MARWYAKVIRNAIAASILSPRLTNAVVGIGILLSVAIEGLIYTAFCYFFPNSSFIHQPQPWEHVLIGVSAFLIVVGLLIGGFIIMRETRNISGS
jgi:hypothetical protein